MAPVLNSTALASLLLGSLGYSVGHGLFGAMAGGQTLH